MPARRPLRIGTDCSGMEAPLMALEGLKVEYSHVFSCDICKMVKKTIDANFPGYTTWYNDLTRRNNRMAPKTDVYVAGFPCQPFSMAGVRQGFEDFKGRGRIFFKVLQYIKMQSPKVFILENVSGLKTQDGGRALERINKGLASIGKYNVYFEVLDSRQHGIPHDRRRCYWVGIRKDIDQGGFEFPAPIPCCKIERLLDTRPDAKAIRKGLPTGAGAANAVKDQLRIIKSKGYDPYTTTHVIDIDSTLPRCKAKKDCSPCLTCARARTGHWVSTWGRRLNKMEMMRLQGMNPARFNLAVSLNQLGTQVGNSMAVNVIERVLCRALPAAGLTGRLVDRWASGAGVQDLITSRNKSFAKDLSGATVEKSSSSSSKCSSLKRKIAPKLVSKAKRAAKKL
mmetsp:Transcript_40148/g.86086  ORF Transcript_40148/g.86086 Transcript_40148/m.86086 type:complete len:396 (-) Transcript_40148:236-1423(-)